MAIQKVRDHLKKYSLDDRIIELDSSSATVEEAAKALNTEPGKIAKTLSFKLDTKPILIVTKGDAKIDNQKYKSTFHHKASMIPYDEVENIIGHAPGGVCPFGVNGGVEVYLDESLKNYDTVFPAAGSSNSAIELTIEELERTSNYTAWIDVTKDNSDGH